MIDVQTAEVPQVPFFCEPVCKEQSLPSPNVHQSVAQGQQVALDNVRGACESGSELNRLLEPAPDLNFLPTLLSPGTFTQGRVQVAACSGTREACKSWDGGDDVVRGKSQDGE